MSSYILRVPSSLNLQSSLEFIRQLRGLPQADEYMIDFQDVRRIEPFGMLLVSSELQRCRSLLFESQFYARNYERNTYAGHMGFFKAFGLNFGNPPGHARGSSRYLPITLHDVNTLERDAALNHQVIGDHIEQQSESMAQILTQTLGGNLVDTLTYCFREIIRNIIEHSQSNQFGYCAQYWPTRSWVEFAILDRGIGIRQSLSRNPYLQISSDRDAINLSLMPGISGTTFGNTRPQSRDIWTNTGFGLFMTSRLCGFGGSFFIASGSSALYLTPANRHYFDTDIHGTALRLCLKIDAIDAINQTLSRLRQEGRQMATNYGRGAVVDASVASTMLRNDFGSSF
ncbi:MAG: hypothetical protein ABFD91_15905 [Anaerohalosphaeraceae bacterium]